MRPAPPPPETWVEGKHEDHDVLVLEVLVRRDHATGHVHSIHRVGSDGVDLVSSWPTGGLEQVAFALLAEAVRREAILDMIIKATHDPEFLSGYKSATPEAQKVILNDLSTALRGTMAQTISRISEAALREALEQITPPG